MKHRTNHPRFKQYLLIIKVILVSLNTMLLYGCAIKGVDIEQEQATGLAGELIDGRAFGQTFKPQNKGLYRIDLYTATYARENTHPVIFHIQVNPDQGKCSVKGTDLVRLEIPAERISNSGPTVITFPQLSDTTGKNLCFLIESPGSVPGDAITVYRNDKDVYSDGQMVMDEKFTDGDLAFIAYTQENFTIADIWNDFYSRASQDKPFFVFYFSLMAILVLALVIVLVWPAQKSIQEGESSDKLLTGNSVPTIKGDE
jgi:hypothetical protein